MVWFIRRYQKGVKNSGTKDVLVSDDEISIGDFVSFAHQTGPGKYILGERDSVKLQTVLLKSLKFPLHGWLPKIIVFSLPKRFRLRKTLNWESYPIQKLWT